MARQPFLPTYRGTEVYLGADLIDELPRVADLVGRCTINWSGVDLNLALTLGVMIGIQNAASVAVFTALRNHRTQRDALDAAAQVALRPHEKEVFDALMAIHNSLDGQRNDVVHCVWGVGVSTPDGIVWSSLHHHANTLILNEHRHANRSHIKPVPDALLEYVFVWSYKDLEELNEKIRQFASAIGSFRAAINLREMEGYLAAFESVASVPAVRQELAKIRSKVSSGA